MAAVLSDWIDATSWMPRIHTREEDFAHCQSLLCHHQVWAADTAQGFGFMAADKGHVLALYLAPELRRAGWGASLLNALKPLQPKLSLWTFQANRPALRFYRAQGFRVDELTDGQGNAEKLPDCLMTWERDRK